MSNNQQITPTTPDAVRQVSGPSTGLLITGIIGAIFSLATFFSLIIGAGLSTVWWKDIPDVYGEIWEGAAGMGSSFVGILVAAFIIYAALKMKELNHWGLTMAASILAMIPCISPCCIIGLPIGIWCLVVLTKPEVKAAFH
jgi:membrane protein insertase Oxa1/YidC/SpoIIIJ